MPIKVIELIRIDRRIIMTQTLQEIWERRNTLMVKDWNGDDPKSGFNIESLITPKSKVNPYGLTYRDSNWRDLSINDFRDLLDDLFYDYSSSKYFDKDHIKRSSVNTAGASLTIYENNKTDITIVATGSDQKYFTIYLNDDVITVSWYKNRGRIDAIIDNEYGKPINIVKFTDILVALELENEYEEV